MSRAERLFNPSALKEPRARVDVGVVRQSILADARELMPSFSKKLKAQSGIPASVRRLKIK